MFHKWGYMSLILKRHLYTFCNLFICHLIFIAHINVTYHKTICCLQPTTSHHTVQGFQSSHEYRRRVFPTFNPSTWCYVYVHFKWPYYSKTFTCMTHSKSETLKGPGLPCHNNPNQVEDGPLCRRTMSARRVICDNFAHFKFIILICMFFFNYSHQWWFLIVGLPATTVYGKFQRGCLRKTFMRSGDMARSCRARLSICNLEGHMPCVLHCVPSRATSRQAFWQKSENDRAFFWLGA